jgi:hypothetical protein
MRGSGIKCGPDGFICRLLASGMHKPNETVCIKQYTDIKSCNGNRNIRLAVLIKTLSKMAILIVEIIFLECC